MWRYSIINGTEFNLANLDPRFLTAKRIWVQSSPWPGHDKSRIFLLVILFTCSMLQVTWSVLASRWLSFLWTVFLISLRKANTTSCLTSFTSQIGEWSRDTLAYVAIATWQDSLSFAKIRGQDNVCFDFFFKKERFTNNNTPTVLSEREKSLFMKLLDFRSLRGSL